MEVNENDRAERLTTERRKIFARENLTLMSMPKEELRRHYNEIFDRLQEYEVAEENNQIIVPPCKVGDKVYVNPYTLGYLSFIDYEHCFIHSKHFVIAEVVSIIKTRKQNLIKLKIYNRTTHTAKYHRYPISSIGKTVFLTREEAEKALEEGK